MNEFGKYLTKARRKAGLTQMQVATRFGFTSAQYISNVERGKCRLAPEYIKPVAKMCGAPIQECFVSYMQDVTAGIKSRAKI